MGTKNNPGRFDCYEKADPDEPMFVLLGRDPYAARLVEIWANTREAHGESLEKIAEARRCMIAMEQWCGEKRDVLRSVTDLDGFQRAYRAGQEAMRAAAEAWVAVHYPDLPGLQDEIRSLPIKDAPNE